MSRPLLASAAVVVAALTSPQARADNWGCEVLLCLSNPAGPMAVSECVPPITRLYHAIFKWRPDPFPTCVMSNGADSASTGNYAYVAPPSYYDACPSGTSAVASDTYAAAGRPATPAEIAAMPSWAQKSFVMTSGQVKGVGEASEFYPSRDTSMPTKVCAANYLGQTTKVIGTSWEDRETITVNVYGRVVLIDPARDTFNINVMLNSSLFRNIRPFTQSTMREL